MKISGKDAVTILSKHTSIVQIHRKNKTNKMIKSKMKLARVAGLLYLGVVLNGIFSLMYVPSKLFIWKDAALTYTNILSSETLYRLSIASGLLCYLFYLILPFVLYKLLSPVNEVVAKLMIILSVVSVPISLLNFQNKFAVLSLIKGKNANGMPMNELQSQVMFFLNQYDYGITIASIFWGLWLLPFGYLVYKSGFLPKLLGILLMAGCFGYLINIFGGIIFQNYFAFGISNYVSIPASLGEIGICLWLLIVGVKESQSKIN